MLIKPVGSPHSASMARTRYEVVVLPSVPVMPTTPSEWLGSPFIHAAASASDERDEPTRICGTPSRATARSAMTADSPVLDRGRGEIVAVDSAPGTATKASRVALARIKGNAANFDRRERHARWRENAAQHAALLQVAHEIAQRPRLRTSLAFGSSSPEHRSHELHRLLQLRYPKQQRVQRVDDQAPSACDDDLAEERDRARIGPDDRIGELHDAEGRGSGYHRADGEQQHRPNDPFHARAGRTTPEHEAERDRLGPTAGSETERDALQPRLETVSTLMVIATVMSASAVSTGVRVSWPL